MHATCFPAAQHTHPMPLVSARNNRQTLGTQTIRRHDRFRSRGNRKSKKCRQLCRRAGGAAKPRPMVSAVQQNIYDCFDTDSSSDSDSDSDIQESIKRKCSMCLQLRHIVTERQDVPLCDACLLGTRHDLRYECERCHRSQIINHPMWRYDGLILSHLKFSRLPYNGLYMQNSESNAN